MEFNIMVISFVALLILGLQKKLHSYMVKEDFILFDELLKISMNTKNSTSKRAIAFTGYYFIWILLSIIASVVAGILWPIIAFLAVIFGIVYLLYRKSN